MPAPDFATLYDFESAIEDAFAAVLRTAMGPAIRGVLVSRSSAFEQTPRVEVALLVGAALRQRSRQGNPIREVPNAFEATLSARLVTCREIDGSEHGALRGLLRYNLSASANVITSLNLPYHQIMEMLPAQSSPQIIDEKQQDVSQLHYSLWFAINNSAWPT